MRKQKDEIPEIAYAVYIEKDNGEFMPISFGDSEWECKVWLSEHKQYLGDIKAYVGLVVDNIHIIL